MSDSPDAAIARPAKVVRLSTLGLSALGVVFGDIGTSPLYTLKTVLNLTGGAPDPSVTLGVLSLVVWTLIVVTAIKYVSVAMRVDNDGEGGILALMSLLGVKRQHRPVIIAFGLFGAALIYAMERSRRQFPCFRHWRGWTSCSRPLTPMCFRYRS